MLTVSMFLISFDGIAPIILCWALGAAFIVTLALINRRRIKSEEPHA
jgi:hypothetical protein